MSDIRSHAHPARPPFSLLRLSAAQRLLGAVLLLVPLWVAVLWIVWLAP